MTAQPYQLLIIGENTASTKEYIQSIYLDGRIPFIETVHIQSDLQFLKADQNWDLVLLDIDVQGWQYAGTLLEQLDAVENQQPIIAIYDHPNKWIEYKLSTRSINEILPRNQITRLGHIIDRILSPEQPKHPLSTERQFRTIFDHSLDVILVIEQDTGQIIEANRAASSVLHYQISELIGQPLERLLPDEIIGFVPELFAEIERSGAAHVTLHCVMADRSLCPVEMDAVTIPWRHSEAILLKMHDIRERQRIRRAEQEAAMLQLALAKEKELNQFISKMLTNAFHEFRTPLASIRLSSELLAHYQAKMSEEKRQNHVDRIAENVEYITTLLDDISLAAAAERKLLAVSLAPVHLKSFVDKIITQQRNQLPLSHQINYEYWGDDVTINTNSDLVEIIIINVISNALKFSPNGGPINVFVRVSDRVEFVISDQGIGIPTQDTKTIFKPFVRGSNVGTIRGIGLGLSIVKQSVERLNGAMFVESEVGVGSQFSILLPSD